MTVLKLKDETGVEVVMVDQDAPAAKAGIKEHDVLLSVNGTHIESEEQLRRVVRETPPGRTVAIGLLRDGQPVSLNVTLADRKEMFKAMAKKGGWPVMPPMPAMPPHSGVPLGESFMDSPQINVLVQTTGRSGIMVEGITPQLGEYFGLRNGGVGVLVRAVEKGSAGEAAGLRAGDIILKVESEKIADPGDWRHALRGKSGQVTVSILRDKKEQTVTLTLAERKRGALVPEEEFENAMKGVEEEMESLRPLMRERAGEFEMIARKMAAPDGEVRIELNRVRDEIRKAIDENRIEVTVTY
jgi:predicted metalloprotease with PDZ domain